MALVNPWLSILVPARNVERYLAPCLASIHKELVGETELLVLDDASTDGTLDVALEWMRRFPNARLLEMSRKVGIGEARNTLLREATGEYVWFIDADDLVLSGAMGSLQEIVASCAPDLIMCDFVSFHADEGGQEAVSGSRKRTFQGPPGQGAGFDGLVAGLLAARQLHVWSKIARKDVMRGVHFPAGKVFEDNAAMPDLLARTGTYYYSAEAWIGYRRRPGSIMSSIDSNSLLDFLDSIACLQRKISPLATTCETRFALDYFCLRGLLWATQRTGEDPEAVAACANIFEQLFEDSARGVLSGCLKRGWLLRSIKLQAGVRKLRSVGYRAG
ncbi:glycosyltransferase family 2 protein [Luteimonas sp. A277]